MSRNVCVKCQKVIKDIAFSYLTTDGRICSKCYERGVNQLNNIINKIVDLDPDVIKDIDLDE